MCGVHQNEPSTSCGCGLRALLDGHRCANFHLSLVKPYDETPFVRRVAFRLPRARAESVWVVCSRPAIKVFLHNELRLSR